VCSKLSDGGDPAKRLGKFERKFLEDGSVKPRRGPPLVRAKASSLSLGQASR